MSPKNCSPIVRRVGILRANPVVWKHFADVVWGERQYPPLETQVCTSWQNNGNIRHLRHRSARDDKHSTITMSHWIWLIRLMFSVGVWWRWALVTSPDGVTPIRMVSGSASVNLPLHHKVQKFSSGTGSPGWSRKKGRKTVVVVVVNVLI